MDRKAWRAAIHRVVKSQTRLSDWTELNWYCSEILNSWHFPHCWVVEIMCLFVFCILTMPISATLIVSDLNLPHFFFIYSGFIFLGYLEQFYTALSSWFQNDSSSHFGMLFLSFHYFGLFLRVMFPFLNCLILWCFCVLKSQYPTYISFYLPLLFLFYVVTRSFPHSFFSSCPLFWKCIAL